MVTIVRKPQRGRWIPCREPLRRTETRFGFDAGGPPAVTRFGFQTGTPVTGDTRNAITGEMWSCRAPSSNLTAAGMNLRCIVHSPSMQSAVRAPEVVVQFSKPAERIAPFTCSFVACVGSTSGSRTSGEHLPSTLAAYFTGAGLVSANSASCSGMRRC